MSACSAACESVNILMYWWWAALFVLKYLAASLIASISAWKTVVFGDKRIEVVYISFLCSYIA